MGEVMPKKQKNISDTKLHIIPPEKPNYTHTGLWVRLDTDSETDFLLAELRIVFILAMYGRKIKRLQQ